MPHSSRPSSLARPELLLEAALAYAAFGWHVFPVVPGGKRPAVPNGFHAASCEASQITAWWAANPHANIGIATDPSGLTVYDVDVAGGKPGATSHAQIAPHLTPTLCARTRSGGYHHYYLAPAGPPLRRIGIRPDGVTAPVGKTGLDLIAKGYVLAPPSVVAGPDEQGTYEWVNATADIAPLPDILRDAALRADARAPITETDIIGEGERNSTLFKIACRMRNAGLSVAEVADALRTINDHRVRPPLPDSELEQIAQSAGQRAESDTARTDDLILDTLKKATEPVAPLPDNPDAPDDDSQIDSFLDKTLLSTGAAEPTPPVIVYPSGFLKLDELLGGGWSSRQLTVILGGPGAGKSALAVAIARHLTTPGPSLPPPVLIVSTELEFAEIAARFASPMLGVPWRDIVRDADIYGKISELTKLPPVHVLDCAALNIHFEAGLEQIFGIAKRIEARYGQPPIILVDYLQSLAARTDDIERRVRTDQVAYALRVISQRVPSVVIAIASVSRTGYGAGLAAIREANSPELYMGLGKESGQIEYEAGTVIFVDIERDESSLDRLGRLVVAKSRHGDIGFCGIRFDPALGVFSYEPEAGKTMSQKTKTLDANRVKIMEFIQKNPGKYSQSDLIKLHKGVGAAGAIAALIADGRVVKEGKYLVPNLEGSFPLI